MIFFEINEANQNNLKSMILFNYFFLLNKYKDNKLIYSQQYNVLKIE